MVGPVGLSLCHHSGCDWMWYVALALSGRPPLARAGPGKARYPRLLARTSVYVEVPARSGRPLLGPFWGRGPAMCFLLSELGGPGRGELSSTWVGAKNCSLLSYRPVHGVCALSSRSPCPLSVPLSPWEVPLSPLGVVQMRRGYGRLDVLGVKLLLAVAFPGASAVQPIFQGRPLLCRGACSSAWLPVTGLSTQRCSE